MNIKDGVPQGSIVGSVLFILYINDFFNSSSKFEFNFNADDTTLLHNTSNVCESIPFINTELLKISKFLYDNHLTLNVAKTKNMIVHKKSTRDPLKFHHITFTTSQLDRTFEAQSLEMILDHCLKFNLQVLNLVNKMSKLNLIFLKVRKLSMRIALKFSITLLCILLLD